jgi:hypothetical protein
LNQLFVEAKALERAIPNGRFHSLGPINRSLLRNSFLPRARRIGDMLAIRRREETIRQRG